MGSFFFLRVDTSTATVERPRAGLAVKASQCQGQIFRHLDPQYSVTVLIIQLPFVLKPDANQGVARFMGSTSLNQLRSIVFGDIMVPNIE